jgi:Ner family transcriptional regulator
MMRQIICMGQKTTRSWDWPAIKAGLERAGSSFAGIAAANRVSRSAVAKVKNRPSDRIQRAIARKLRVSPWDIWPDRYPNKAGR